MPLTMKTLKQVSAELGIPEKEIRAMVDMRKIRAIWKQSQLVIAPDEIARIRKMRKTIPESVQPAIPAPVTKPATPTTISGKPGVPNKPGATGATGSTAKPAPGTTRPTAPKPGLKLPPPPPQ